MSLYVVYNVSETAIRIEAKKVGNSTGFIIPRDVAIRLGIEQGIAFIAMMTFLRRNGVRFAPEPAQAAAIILALAAGKVSEDSLARWIKDNWPRS